jgi:hypothetical protein
MNAHKGDPITSYEAAAAIEGDAEGAAVNAWIPWCPACGVEDHGIKGYGPDAPGLLIRLRCKGCGAGVVALRDAA